MIEFAILFGLGFLSAILLVALMAPAINRRIMSYTEKRLRATMPISPQEVRAQKDMARALYAAENAKTRQELDTERERALTLKFKNDTAVTDASRLLADTRELKLQVEEMTLEAGDLRAKARRHEEAASKLRAQLQHAEETSVSRATEIANLTKRVSAISREFDDLKITLSARDIEVEQARHKTATWRKERDAMTKELEEVSAKSRETTNHLSRESRKITRLEEQLAAEAARNADNETTIERRTQEIARLKERLTATGGQPNDMVIRLQNPAVSNTTQVAQEETTDLLIEPPAPLVQIGADATADQIAKEIEDIRNQGTALTERLLNVKGGKSDEAIRTEIAQIAARMIAVTAAKEGEASPIPGIIANAAPGDGRQNLATRAGDLIARQHG